MDEPKPDIQKEAQREKLAHDFYKFYFLLGETLQEIDKIMSGKDSPDFNDISDDERERRAVLRHSIGNWIMAPTLPIISGRMEVFVGLEKNNEMDRDAEALLRDVANSQFTWKKRIEMSRDFILQCLVVLYPETSIEKIREKFGGIEKEQAWIKKPTDQSPRT